MTFFAFFVETLLQTACFWIITYGGNFLIRYGFSKIHQRQVDDSNRLGRHIGAAERALLFMGLYADRWELVTGVIALKALARFKEMERKDFAEYFLIGSLWSLIYCLACAWIYGNWIGFFSSGRIHALGSLL